MSNQPALNIAAQGCVSPGVGLGQLGGSVGPTYPVAEKSMQPPKPQVTHMEIRRVQNGFVVMAINAEVHEQYGLYKGPQRWSFVAKDTAELGALLTSIVDGGVDLDWVPSMDLPIIDLHRRVEAK